jgi:tyrosyl-tRNA synthetase
MIISKLKLSRRQLNLHLCPIVVQSQILKKWSYKMVVNKTYEKVSFNLPTDIKSYNMEDNIWICKALVDAGIEPSSSQARRDIKQGAVRINQEKISDEKMQLSKGEYTLQVGKRKFAQVRII